MSNNESDNDRPSEPFEQQRDNEDSSFNTGVFGRAGTGKTQGISTKFVRRRMDGTEGSEFIDPKGEGEIECPLSDSSEANETAQINSKDAPDREGGGESSS